MPKRARTLNKRLAVRIARQYQDFTGTPEELLVLLQQDKELVGIDPMLIIAGVSLIINIIRLIQEYRRKKNASSVLLLDDDEILAQLS